MNARVLPMPERAGPDDQAREWIVRIDAGPLTPEEREELKAWLAEDTRHARLLDEHALLWNAARQATFPRSSTADAASTAGPTVRARAGWRIPVAAAFASLMVTAVVWLGGIGSGSESIHPVSMSTEIGEHRPIDLADGSRMHLNTASTARVAFGKDRRRVVLDQGEGLFDVAKDAKRPFEVVAGRTIVRAVGTRFLVRRLPDGQAEVTVFEGVVELQTASTDGLDARAKPGEARPVRLSVGQAILPSAGRIVMRTLGTPDLERKVAWQQDRLLFDGTSLAEAVEQVNRYSKTPLRLGDASLSSVRVSGAFSTRDIRVFLLSLEQGFGLRVEQTSDGYVISEPPKPRKG